MEQQHREDYGYYEMPSAAQNDAQQSVYSQERIEERQREVINKTFIYMFGVLLLSALSAFVVSETTLFETIFLNPAALIGFGVAELITVCLASWTLSNNKTKISAVLLVVYSIVNGATLSYVFKLYTAGTIVYTFVTVSLMFAGMAIFGMTTKKNLSIIGRIGMMALIGVIVLMVVNIFAGSNQLDLLISAVGLVIFIGLTAYDTQKIKKMAALNTNLSVPTIAMLGALELYLDLINMFLYLLRIFTSRD